MLSTVLWLILPLLDAVPPPASPVSPASPATEPSLIERRWGIETGPFWIAVGNFLRPKLTFTGWRRGGLAGDVLLAPLFRIPQQVDDGEIFEVGGELGYRQYLWRGFNVEVSALVMRSRVDSNIDNRRHVGLNIFLAGNAGWRFDLRLRRATLYVLPQLGLGRDVLRTDPPPTPDGLQVILVGELLAGVRF